jgi:hypothetical protein
LIWSSEKYLVRGTDGKAPRYIVLCSVLSFATGNEWGTCMAMHKGYQNQYIVNKWNREHGGYDVSRNMKVIWCYYYYYLLQLGCHPVAVVLTLVHTIQMFSPGGSSPYTSTHNTNVFSRWQ